MADEHVSIERASIPLADKLENKILLYFYSFFRRLRFEHKEYRNISVEISIENF